jgi:Fibronectin type III domain
MFNIEDVRKNNRTGLLISSFAAHIPAIALVLIMVLGPSTASARRPPTPENFRVTATTAYTVTVAWNAPRNNSGNFNYHLSGAYGVTPAVLPNTATSHTFTRLHHGNQYWLFIYARDAGGQASGQAQVTTRTLLDTTTPSTGPVINVTDVGSNYVSVSLTPSRAGRLPFSFLPSIGEWQPSDSLEPKPVDHPSPSPAGDDLQLDCPAEMRGSIGHRSVLPFP